MSTRSVVGHHYPTHARILILVDTERQHLCVITHVVVRDVDLGGKTSIPRRGVVYRRLATTQRQATIGDVYVAATGNAVCVNNQASICVHLTVNRIDQKYCACGRIVVDTVN